MVRLMRIRSGGSTKSVGIDHGATANSVHPVTFCRKEWRFSRRFNNGLGPQQFSCFREATAWQAWPGQGKVGALWLGAILLVSGLTTELLANPQGMTVSAGSATATSRGSMLDIRTSR